MEKRLQIMDLHNFIPLLMNSSQDRNVHFPLRAQPPSDLSVFYLFILRMWDRGTVQCVLLDLHSRMSLLSGHAHHSDLKRLHLAPSSSAS